MVLLPFAGAAGAVDEYLRSLASAGGRPPIAAIEGSASKSAVERGWTPDIVASSAEAGAFVQSVTLYVLESRG
jgi:hypothetical protein